MTKMFPVLALLGLCVWVSCCAATPDPQPVRAIAALDLTRYAGRWYEVAKFPNRFQTQCTGDTTAEYSLLPDGGVRVDNRCRRQDGAFDEAIGRAERVGDNGSAKLRVRFAPRWLGWLPLVWGDYWVIDLDPDYQLAAVGDPRRDYLWILSRSPIVDEVRYRTLCDRLRAQGFDTQRLEMTPQQRAP